MAKISEMPKIERPREKLIERGVVNLKNEELLAILLGSGIEGKNVVEVAQGILRKHKISKLLKLSYQELSKIKGIGEAKACLILASKEFVSRGLAKPEGTLPVILAHNHPTGDPAPSNFDLEITKRIVEAGKIMGVEVLDHIIITKENFFSFKESNLI